MTACKQQGELCGDQTTFDYDRLREVSPGAVIAGPKIIPTQVCPLFFQFYLRVQEHNFGFLVPNMRKDLSPTVDRVGKIRSPPH